MDRLKLNGISSSGNFYEVNDTRDTEKADYYFLSNDEIKVDFNKSLKNRCNITSLGIATPHYLHLLSELSNYDDKIMVTAIDNNFEQLKHFKRLVDYIKMSSNRIEFVQNLFKIKLGKPAIHLLNRIKPSPRGHIRGGVSKDNFFPSEKQLWEDIVFLKNDFVSEYHIEEVNKTEIGLKIKAQTIGDINRYYATILSASRKNYDYWPFTLAYGCGFLRSEEDYQSFKSFLYKSEFYYIYGDLCKVAYNVLMANRYKTIVFWISNILINYFIEKEPKLKGLKEQLFSLGVAREPDFPELDLVLVQDMRDPIRVPREINPNRNRNRRLSIHTKTFCRVVKHIQGFNNIEIINMPGWFEKDNGISKLPNTIYKKAKDFLANNEKAFYDTIFVHILVGHGMDYTTYRLLLKKALKRSKNLVILEHNKNSKDFRHKNTGLTVQEIRDILGKERSFEYCPGDKTKDRNLLLVYKGEL